MTEKPCYTVFVTTLNRQKTVWVMVNWQRRYIVTIAALSSALPLTPLP
ncbi:hypothetical protein H6G63_06280 [Leptolyngbya sp. FACHB-402]|nr:MULTISPECIES: hypothetical protein [unclassified Leptolyngbya]MBD2372855.1 hypothetical protein [Leptolyngbya sp. FACHB-238]MBD2397392.1 hypothetical protein [Leptolyngbya sp. FACHB-239]MBD2403803.1 hypothetical protein [Leptolyngbya sp. FACHB-402]